MKTEGIILHVLNFREYDQILTVFSHDLGLLKLFYRGGQSQGRKKGASTEPLTQVDLVMREGRGELYLLNEISVIRSSLHFRKDLDTLETACSLAGLILKTQLPGKAAPELYQLLHLYLKALPTFQAKDHLSFSFLLKLLRHEGLIGFNERCSVCESPLLETAYLKEETFCLKHAQQDAIPFTLQEREWIYRLAFCRTLSELNTLAVDAVFIDKLKSWRSILLEF